MREAREIIIKSLKATGITDKNIFFSRNVLPSSFPCAMVVLDEEAGIDKTGSRYLNQEYAFNVFLIISAEKSTDPDVEVYDLKESFRAHYLNHTKYDFSKVFYYDARAESSRKIKVAKISVVLR